MHVSEDSGLGWQTYLYLYMFLDDLWGGPSVLSATSPRAGLAFLKSRHRAAIAPVFSCKVGSKGYVLLPSNCGNGR